MPHPPSLLNRVVTTGLFLLFVTIVIGLVSGLSINWQARQIEQRGGIRIVYDPKNAEALLNGQSVDTQSPYLTTTLKPGRYQTTVKKTGYRPWTANWNVIAGRVDENEHVLLFLTDLTPVPVVSDSEKQTAQTLFANAERAVPGYGVISTSGGELSVDGAFITRFSADIVQAHWFNDENHLLLQVGKQIMVAEVDGTDRVSLITLADAALAKLATDRDAKLLYLQQTDGTIQKIVLR